MKFIHHYFAQTLFGTSLLFVFIVLTGWFLGFEGLTTGFDANSSMKVNTALGLGGLALSGLCLHYKNFRGLGWLFNSLCFVIAIGTLIQDAFHINLGIDELIVNDPNSVVGGWAPGRPSILTALSFLILSSAFYLILIQNKFSKLAQFLVSFISILSIQSVFRHALGIKSGNFAQVLQMSDNTSFCLAITCLGIYLTHPDSETYRIFVNKNRASRICKILLVFAVSVTPLVSFIESFGIEKGLWNSSFGTVLNILLHVFIYVWVALETGFVLARSEEKDKQYQAKLVKAIESRDEFLTLASHELRTPLTSMQLHTQLIEKKGLNDVSPERLEKFLDYINKDVSRMSRLINDMLDISMIQNNMFNMEMRLNSLKSILEQTIGILTPRIQEAGVVVEKHFDETDYQLNVDSKRMGQAIASIINNALKYAPNGTLKVSYQETLEDVTLTFEDSGRGISENDISRIFVRYERLVSPSETSGLGLGLYLARKIVEAHNGIITVESEPGKGSKFQIRFSKLKKEKA